MCELLEGRPDISRDPAKAFQMAEEGSQAGCIHSKGILGRCYITGSGVGLDLHRGLELGRDSSLAGSSYGEFVVAFAYENGSGGVRTDLQESVEHYKMAVQHGIAEAQYRLAHVYICNRYFKFGDKTQYTDKNPVKKNMADALNLLRLASEQGHADAQISLALHLRAFAKYSASDYSSPSNDFNEAFMMLKRGVKQGSARRHLEGLHGIACLYKRLGDNVEAFNYYKLASDQGHSVSSFQLAKMHQHGEGVNKDVEEAISIYKRLIEKGAYGSFAAIRDLYLEDGDNAEALKWCKRGADEGCDWGLVHDVARMYEGWDPRDPNYERLNVALEGDGIERDFVEAAKYYKLACELFSDDEDVADSAYELAKIYEVI
jgi:TPR repeat protein